MTIIDNVNDRKSRAAGWTSLGATAPEAEQLLAYSENEFDLSRLPAGYPVADEPSVATWHTYVDAARTDGAFACLRERLVQLQFPIAEGISETVRYRAATRRGDCEPRAIAPTPARLASLVDDGLRLLRPSELRLFLAETPAGRIPVILAAAREDFVSLVQALSRKNEPWPVPDAMGACIIGGYNNWDRIRSLRRDWERTPAAERSAPDWESRFREIRAEPALFQDRFILLSSGPYSAAVAAGVGMEEAQWRRTSITIRLEHECTHYVTRRVLGSMRNRLADELIADYMGIIAAAGRFRPDWLLTFMGLEDHPRYRAGARLGHYRQGSQLDDGSFAVLQTAVVRAAQSLAAIDQLRDATWDMTAKAHTIVALAALGLEGLLAPERAPALFRQVMSRVSGAHTLATANGISGRDISTR